MPTTARQFDIGIVIALREELRYMLEIVPQLESIPYQGAYFYRLDFGAVSAICCVMEKMGTLPALQAAMRLLEFANLRLLVLVGVAGGLDSDVGLGDVVVGSEVNEFQANSKAEATPDGYEVRYSGRHWPLDYPIREALVNFEFAAAGHYEAWKSATQEPSALGETQVPQLHIGSIASGNIVAASRAFVDEIKRIDRKFVAVDMESAGIAAAAQERIHPRPFLILRGISDKGDEAKAKLDGEGKRRWRRLAVRNATLFLAHLLKWEGFRGALGLDSPADVDGAQLLRDLAVRLKSCTGGVWLAGVTFDVYSHAPAKTATGQPAVELYRLRTLDATARIILDAADKAKERLLAGGDLDEAAGHYSHLASSFCDYLAAPDAIASLKDLDNVVLAIVLPEAGNEHEALLLQADRLEEDVGIEAAIEFLKDFVSLGNPIRARYIEALAVVQRWDEIAEALRKCDPGELSRGELENGCTAYAEKGDGPSAQTLMRLHKRQFMDKAATIIRQAMARRYPNIVFFSQGDSA